MTNKTYRTAYKRHQYSGPRKSLKRVRCGLKRFYGEESRLKVWRSNETKKKPMKEEIVLVATQNFIVTQNTQLKTYARLKSTIRLGASYSGPSTSTVTAEPVVGQSSFVEVAQNESKFETLVVKLEPPEYYKQHTQGESSTTAAATNIRLTEELDESGLLRETDLKIEKIEIGEEGFS